MRILFYLPVITPWWFESIIAPMLRALQSGRPAVDLHVMIAPMWRGTGIEAQHLMAAADLAEVHWHVIDQADPEQFRLAGAEVPGLVDLVDEIGPDLTLARSADIATTRHFPGLVRFIMEAGAPPFASDQRWIVLDEEPFTQSALAADDGGLAENCARRLTPAWDLAARDAPGGTRTALRNLMGLPLDRPVLAVPLHYEHHENYFLSLAAFPDGEAMIEGLLAATCEDVVLAVTDHPLNRLHVDRHSVDECMARHAGRVVDCTGWRATDRLALCADAMVADLSKSWSLAAFHGLPLLEVARRPLSPWLKAVRDLGALAPPEPGATRRWFGRHLGARVIDPLQLTPDRLLRVIEGQPSDEDVAGNIAMVLAWQVERADREAAA
jgi:hypothetical protein